MIASANLQTEGVVAILRSHATYDFFGKGFQEYLTVHASTRYGYLLSGDAPLSPDIATLRKHTGGRGDSLLVQHGYMLYMTDKYENWLFALGPDKFLKHWRRRSVAQAKASLNPLHLLSGVSSDYYAVILVGIGYASVPVFMSCSATGVCHVVHAPPGTNDTTTGMPLQDVYLPMEFHCFIRHVRMLRIADTEDTDFRTLLPRPTDWSQYTLRAGPAMTCTHTVELRSGSARGGNRDGGRGSSTGSHYGSEDH